MNAEIKEKDESEVKVEEKVAMEEISLWQQIKEDFSVPRLNDPALDSNFELFFNYPGVWAIVSFRVTSKLYKGGWKRISRVLNGITQTISNIDIHPAATIGRRVFIDHGFGVVIGATAILKNDILIYQGVTLGGVSLDKGKRHPTIESNCVIGSGAKVLGNITIGENSKVGANSVVVSDVCADSTAVGVPAKIIKREKDKCKLAHDEFPDVNKEMFTYLLKRVAVLEHALKEQDGIDVSKEDKQLEKIYSDFIEAMNSSK